MSVLHGRHYRIAFGLFEADLNTGELWRSGHRVKLQSLPFKVLAILLENAGEIVPREELQRLVWGIDVNVDFEQALGSAIKKIREALGDSADNPRFVETLSRRGYRFIAPASPLVMDERPAPPPAAELTRPIEVILSPPPEAALSRTHPVASRSAFMGWLLFALAMNLSLAGIVYRTWEGHPAQASPLRVSQVTSNGQVYHQGARSFETLPAIVANGEHLFTSAVVSGRLVLAQISIATGEMQKLALPSEVGEPEVNAISDDGSRLILRSQSPVGLEESEQPLWVVPTSGGSALRVSNVVGHAATWMPHSDAILYANGTKILEIPVEGGNPRLFATVPGRAFWLRWSPDQKLLRFSVLDLKAHTSSLWEIAAGQHVAHPILADWSKPSSERCGIWTADSKYFVFESSHDGHTDLWRMDGTATTKPVRVTNGPLSYEAPAPARKDAQIFFVGRDASVTWQLEEYDPRRKELLPRQDFLANAARISFSRDRQSISWTDINGHLWRSHIDGSEKLELTPDWLDVLNANWSPDGQSLVMMARGLKQSWGIYRIDSTGGGLQRLSEENIASVGDPTFSPDGHSIVFGGLPFLMGPKSAQLLEILDLKTRQAAPLPGSEQLYSPRWSPDGRYIAALSLDQQKLMLYDIAHQSWKTLVTMAISDPTWSFDGEAIYFQAYKAENQPIYRVSVAGGRPEIVVDFACGFDATRCFLTGVTPNNIPLVLVETGRGNLYTTDLRAQPSN